MEEGWACTGGGWEVRARLGVEIDPTLKSGFFRSDSGTCKEGKEKAKKAMKGVQGRGKWGACTAGRGEVVGVGMGELGPCQEK